MTASSQEQKNEAALCPKCHAILSENKQRGPVLYLRIVGVFFIVGSVILAVSLAHEEMTILAIFNVILGALFIFKGAYWAARTVLKCKQCGYMRVKKAR
jgi:Zn-dependent protease